VIQAVCEKRLRRRDAASQLGISERQAQRLINRYRVSGAEGLVSRKRGQPSNRRLTESLKLRVLTLIRENYSDFGPTLAAEKLRERHDIRLSIETVRNWMTSDGLWVPHARRKSRVYQPRHRRDCWVNLSRSTAPTMTGLKAVRQNAAFWYLSMMPPAA
jgi:transposase